MALIRNSHQNNFNLVVSDCTVWWYITFLWPKISEKPMKYNFCWHLCFILLEIGSFQKLHWNPYIIQDIFVKSFYSRNKTFVIFRDLWGNSLLILQVLKLMVRHNYLSGYLNIVLVFAKCSIDSEFCIILLTGALAVINSLWISIKSSYYGGNYS